MCELRLGHHMTLLLGYTHTVRANLVSLVSLTLLRGLLPLNAGAVMIASAGLPSTHTHTLYRCQNHIRMNAFSVILALFLLNSLPSCLNEDVH